MVMQNAGPVQSIAVMPCAADSVAGGCHTLPLKKATWFVLGAAAQKVGLPQDRYDVPCGEAAGTGGPSELTFSTNSR